MRRKEDIAYAGGLGVDMLGLVFVDGSPRSLTPETAAALRDEWPSGVERVALFVNPQASFVRTVIDAVEPTYLQFHGNEERDFCESFKIPYIKALEPSSQMHFEAYEGSARLFLIDSHTGTGGTGVAFDWSEHSGMTAQTSTPLLLAGGLNADNVGVALKHMRPWGVDVSGGIEQEKGVKDHTRMKQFVEAVRAFDENES